MGWPVAKGWMPTWATGSSDLPAQRGFSLLELLVVLAIAGLMTGLSVAWLDNGRTRVDQAMQRLLAATREQSAVARHTGQLRGLRWNGKRPEFVRHDGTGWVVEPVTLGDWPQDLRPDWPGAAAPQLVFTPEGWARPGKVNWRSAEGSQRWSWGREGRLQVAVLP